MEKKITVQVVRHVLTRYLLEEVTFDVACYPECEGMSPAEIEKYINGNMYEMADLPEDTDGICEAGGNLGETLTRHRTL